MRRDHGVLVSPIILGIKPNKLGIKPNLLGLIPKLGQDATFVYHEHVRFPRPFLIVHLARANTSAQVKPVQNTIG